MSRPLKVVPLDSLPVAVEDGNTAVALLVFLAGHGRCGGWGFDPEADTIRCRCGDLAFHVDTKIGAST